MTISCARVRTKNQQADRFQYATTAHIVQTILHASNAKLDMGWKKLPRASRIKRPTRLIPKHSPATKGYPFSSNRCVGPALLHHNASSHLLLICPDTSPKKGRDKGTHWRGLEQPEGRNLDTPLRVDTVHSLHSTTLRTSQANHLVRVRICNSLAAYQ
ncbi:hypothetical protein CC2G_009992 [Coprinopsis cinerea AmutBmut pab1-1]|nr:hypothetical protein CC2G_009992 [Coprinopsis cinerea AmutBmut pab1-1]